MQKASMAVLMALNCIAGHTQQLPDAVDLKSAYCLAVVQNQVLGLEASINTNPALPERQQALIVASQNDAKARLDRIRRYLFPRIPYLDPTGLAVARQQGIDDQARSVKLLSDCINTCQTRECLEACEPPDLAAKVRACAKTDWLPF